MNTAEILSRVQALDTASDIDVDPIAVVSLDMYIQRMYGLDNIAIPEGIKRIILRAVVVIQEYEEQTND